MIYACPNAGSRHARRGFTLLELVVAMGMVAVLAFSLYASMRIAFRARDSAESSLEPVRTAELAFEFLRQDLNNAIPPGGVLAGSFIGADSQSDEGRSGDALQFFTTAAAPEHPSANGEIKNEQLALATPDGYSDRCLVRRVVRNLLSQFQVSPDEEVICRGVSALNLRYYNGTTWADSWDSSQQSDALPNAIEITLELDRPAGSAQPRTYRFVRVFPIACGTDQGGLLSL